MLKNLSYKIGQAYLISKIFKNIVPRNLYSKVFLNTYKNLLHLYTPSSAVLGLTYRCQCECVHCSAGLYAKDHKRELTTKEWFKVLDNISSLGIPRINISGGEALLREDIFEIIEYATRNFVVILESNGQMLTSQNAKYLKKSRISCVAISIDSPDPSVHDELRRLKGCFRYAIDGIANIRKLRIPCLLSTYVTSDKGNLSNLNRILVLAKQLKVIAVRIMPSRPVGSFSCNVNSLLDKTGEKNIMRSINPYIAYFKGIPSPRQCGILCKATFYISPYGEVQPCPYMPLSFGNVKGQHLNILLDRMWGHKIFKLEYKDCFILNNNFREKILNPLINRSYSLPISIEE